MDKPMGQPDQTILAVDDQGNFQGEYIPKEVGHTGKGKRHLAITVLLYNNKNQVLLQKRKHKVFDNIWDITGATHPLHNSDGTDETLEQSTWRCLDREYNIKEKIPLKNQGFFDYFAQYGQVCENEHCAILIGEWNGKIDLNPEVGYDFQWMDKNQFLTDIEKNPDKYSKWALEAVSVLKQTNFFN